ncbi:unnamed protein product [Didymodactylos carnosus]|uniref:Glycosyltransferase family 34 protein n=1 Tax=Didymodactylos carnosus TaxID=1234261 RepID=A0A815HNM5_9BILA|nr:unnamed protein product [Didymodactylos carnosus]CAF4230531.1 unnamed protein product [Didymodactylos carnosus]
MLILFFLHRFLASFYVKESYAESKTSKLLIATGISPKPCKTSIGDYVNLQSFLNKLQYSELKGYESEFNAIQVDREMNGPWNKVALIKKLLKERQNEWIMWVDSDALIVNMSFDIPFDRYVGYNLVIWGLDDLLYKKGDPFNGINTGVFLIRNCDWSREFIELIDSFGKKDGRIKEDLLEKYLNKYLWGLFEQNAFCYVLKNYEIYKNKTFLETTYDLNGFWKQAFHKLEWNPFILHFAGCQFCSGSNNSLDVCLEKWNYFNRKANETYEAIKI